MRLAEWLSTKSAGLTFFVMALITQLTHAQDVALGASKHKLLDYLSSWGFALSLETAVLYSVVNKKHNFSYLFATFSVGINLAYYESSMAQGASMFYISQFGSTWPKWLVSAILPFAIAFYSHTVANGTDPAKKESQEEEVVQEVVQTEFASDDEKDEKHEQVLQALRGGSKSKAQLASETGIAQSTLFRANGGKPKGCLPDMEKNHLITSHANGKQVMYSLNGASK